MLVTSCSNCNSCNFSGYSCSWLYKFY